MSESDGIEESIDGTTRVAMTVAARTAADLAREFERRRKDARDRDVRQAREDATRTEALWQQTRAELAPVMQERWWEQARPADIAHAYEQARAYDSEDARAYRDRIRDEVRDRYGVDVDDLAREGGSDEHRERDEAERDRAEASRLTTEADQADRAAEGAHDGPEAEQEHDRATTALEDASTIYDSAERREAMAEEMRSRGVDRDVVEARVAADTGQAAPARDAVKSPAKRTPPARRNRGQAGKARQVERG